MRSILFTFDYELYGDGTGDIFKHIVEPTERLFEIAREYGIKYTIFFEVIEYWHLKAQWELGNDMGYVHDPITAMEDQLRRAYLEGHDIQLHLHPQWVDAVWHGGRWQLNMSEWCLGRYEREGEHSLLNLLKRGKDTLEGIIRPIAPDYSCIALRAGGYNAQPSQRIIEAMREVGLVIDSSIFPGGLESGPRCNYDYTGVDPRLGWWYVSDCLERPVDGATDLIELPIVALPIHRFEKYLSTDRMRALLKNKKSASDTYFSKTSHKKSLSGKLKYFFEQEWQTWDFCLFSKRLHRRFLQGIEEQERDTLVLIGHPKSFVLGENFETLLKLLPQGYRAVTVSEWYENHK